MLGAFMEGSPSDLLRRVLGDDPIWLEPKPHIRAAAALPAKSRAGMNSATGLTFYTRPI
jgi:hypothetical protein